MDLEYLCNYCSIEFKESDRMRYQINNNEYSLKCPYCASEDITLTIQSQLLIDRKIKLNNIDDTTGTV
jgi:Zn finger protein HypA/HybF involved in hydrogenase expression